MIRRLSTTQLVVDGVLAIAFFAVAGFFGGVSIGSVFVSFGIAAAIAIRRLAPGIALAVVWAVALGQLAAIAVGSVSASAQLADLGILAILYVTSAYGGRTLRWIGFASAFLGAVGVAAGLTWPSISYGLVSDARATETDPGPFLGSFLGTLLLTFFGALAAFLLAWTLGILARAWMRVRDSRRAASDAERQVAAEQERTRIARDMHDVVAHSLAVVIAQADGARYLRKTDPEAVDDALLAISSTARDALADVRVLLAQLRHRQADGPQPSLAELDRLYDQLRASGLPLSSTASGDALPLGTSAQLAVFRIVQESLTNALRHADAAKEVVVAFDWTPTGLQLSISSALREVTRHSGALPLGAGGAHPGGAGGAPVGGHGIAGMTERASLVGGRLDARAEGTRFVVRAWLPAQATAATPLQQSPPPQRTPQQRVTT